MKKKTMKERWYEYIKAGYFLYRDITYFAIRCCSTFVPLKNKICATCFNGTKYGDNTKFIVEKLHEKYPGLKICWLMDYNSKYPLPDYINGVRCFSDWRFAKRFWEYSTSKVIIDTHLIDSCFKKRKGQVFIETWHGGLGIKRIENDVDKYKNVSSHDRKIKNTVTQADYFISNSEHLTNIYKRAFGRANRIWEIGYPKNDILVNSSEETILSIRNKVRDYFSLNRDSIIVTYAPTFRDKARTNGQFDQNPYLLDPTVVDSFASLFNNNDCHIIYKMHPFVAQFAQELDLEGEYMHDGTAYPDMQELIMASDAFISDYSSCIFDAALFSLPCFIFATDFKEYAADRGTYFLLDELPFPNAENNDQLKYNILNYDYGLYQKKWEEFAKHVGLKEMGNASEILADYIAAACK